MSKKKTSKPQQKSPDKKSGPAAGPEKLTGIELKQTIPNPEGGDEFELDIRISIRPKGAAVPKGNYSCGDTSCITTCSISCGGQTCSGPPHC